MTEALLFGIPSRILGRCFSGTRPKVLRDLSEHLSDVCESRNLQE